MRLLFMHDALRKTEIDVVYLVWMGWFLEGMSCVQKYARLVRITSGLERGSYVSRKSLA